MDFSNLDVINNRHSTINLAWFDVVVAFKSIWLVVLIFDIHAFIKCNRSNFKVIPK